MRQSKDILPPQGWVKYPQRFSPEQGENVDCEYVGKLCSSGRPYGAAGRWKMFYFHRGGRGIKCVPLNAVCILPARTINLQGDTLPPFPVIPFQITRNIFLTAIRGEILPVSLTTNAPYLNPLPLAVFHNRGDSHLSLWR